ncbi:MAG TPA: type I-E CRISPR-associated protein Cse2/CasB [Firmicutes bacterium]|nr:type I-E CRISPR-associated protein Cse2/CasB [Bacillota bacterium]
MEQLAGTSIYQVSARILNLIAGDLQASSTKAYLASLRQSVNRDVHLATGVFPVIFSNIPTEYLGESGDLTSGERSIILALQLFALHQQGSDQSVNAQSDPKADKAFADLGKSLRSLRAVDDSQAIDRRFNAMITATSFDELANHLRHLIKLLKSRTDTKVDYAQLAQDLFWFQKGQKSSIRLKWSRSYYRHYNDDKGEDSNEGQ